MCGAVACFLKRPNAAGLPEDLLESRLGRCGELRLVVLRALEPEARVRCLVRDAASAQARALEQLGVQLVAGDLTEPRARAELLEGGARCVISTAGTVGRYRKLGDVLGGLGAGPGGGSEPRGFRLL